MKLWTKVERPLIFYSIIIVLVITLNLGIVRAGEWEHYYRYLDDDASYNGGTFEYDGGDAEVRYGNIDDIGLYADTDGGSEIARAYAYIDGREGGSTCEWTFLNTQYYYIKVYWEISGNYDEAGSNFLKFEYQLYYMDYETKVVVKSWTKEYTADFDYDETTTYHYAGGATLTDDFTYYLYCKATLYHYSSDANSNIYSGANKIDFMYVDFFAWIT